MYEVDADTLLLVASDRVSAFDVVMREPVAFKGAVLTQLSAFWFGRLAPRDPQPPASPPTRPTSSRACRRSPRIATRWWAGPCSCGARRPWPFECVVRGYLAGSAWSEYRKTGTLAGEPLPPGLVESQKLEPAIFSPATKADTGHDENVTFAHVARALGAALAESLKRASLALYEEGRAYAVGHGIIIADTKFEFGTTPDGTLLLIDEVLTPDSSRFWPADRYQPGTSQPSFDKQPLRDFLAGLEGPGQVGRQRAAARAPAVVIAATSARYREAYRLITGASLEVPR